MDYGFQMAWHVDTVSWPEWGSAPRGNLVRFDMAHVGEWMTSVIGPDVETGTPRIYHIVRCEFCICIHAWPLPRPEALKHYYQEHFYQIDKNDMLQRYLDDKFWWSECTYKPLLRQCRDYLSPKQRLRMLDVGSGPAISLDCGQELGFETLGIEPNTALCHRAAEHGHRMFNGTLQDIHLRESVDLIIAYETLEHSEAPEQFLLQCWEYLAPGGLIIVAVPQEWNTLQQAVCRNLHLPPYWATTAVPQHLNFFTRDCLKLLLRRTGFSILDARSTYPMEHFILEGRNYLGNDAVGRECHHIRCQEEVSAIKNDSWRAMELQYRNNLEEHVGREMIFIAQAVK